MTVRSKGKWIFSAVDVFTLTYSGVHQRKNSFIILSTYTNKRIKYLPDGALICFF